MIREVLSITNHKLPAYITPDGVPRLLSAFPSLKIRATPINEVHSIIPRNKWEPFIEKRVNVPILDQASHGQCVGYAAAAGLMLSRDELGMDFELLSGSFIYSQINGGRDAGSDPADAA